MNILITGGAGYIGSHVAKQLLEETEHNIIILDNLSTGSIKTLETLKTIREYLFIQLDLKEFDAINRILEDHEIDTIIHFAASIVVPESVKNPLKYYMNNTVNTTNLINCSIQNSVKRFIFSSTAAVYGEPENIDEEGIDEECQTNPINPYGMSKLMSENILKDMGRACPDFKYVIFRYFNVAGADIYYNNEKLSPRIGQSFPDATHLIKIASECAALKRNKMSIFGDDFNTTDGTGVRDYIHIDDLASAHIKAITFLDKNSSNIFNLGYGKGYSVKEVINTMKYISKKDFSVKTVDRREGDPAILISNNKKIISNYKDKFNWIPKYDNIELICGSAYAWEKSENS